MLQSILGFDQSPKYLDATDALAVAYTAHLQLSNPVIQMVEESKSRKVKKSTKKQWSDFINNNPELVN
jgi:Holliday junction resolvasome RuvABC endonuclease subunit